MRLSSAITISNLAFPVLRLCTCRGVRPSSSLQDFSTPIVTCKQGSHRENQMVNGNQTVILVLSLLNFCCVETFSFGSCSPKSCFICRSLNNSRLTTADQCSVCSQNHCSIISCQHVQKSRLKLALTTGSPSRLVLLLARFVRSQQLFKSCIEKCWKGLL